jgi:hypothetical protein
MIRPKNIPEQSKFLEGVGESAWFHIQRNGSFGTYQISRYDVLGDLECQYIAKPNNTAFDIDAEYEISYVSHCMKCTIIQNGTKIIFYKV